SLQMATGISSSDAVAKGMGIGFVVAMVGGSIHPRSAPPECLTCRRGISRVYWIPGMMLAGIIVGSIVANDKWTDVRWPPVGPWEPESPERSLVRGRHVRVDTVGGGTLNAHIVERRADMLVLNARGR